MLDFVKVWHGDRMNISLTPKLESFVREKVKTGDYNNASEVIREALRALQEREAERKLQLRVLKRLIRDGEESGPPVDWSPDRIKAKARALVRKRA